MFVPLCLWCFKLDVLPITSLALCILCTYCMNFPGKALWEEQTSSSPVIYTMALFSFLRPEIVFHPLEYTGRSAFCLRFAVWSLSSHSTENCFLHDNMQREIRFIHFCMENVEDKWKERVCNVAANIHFILNPYPCLWELQQVVHFLQGCWFDPQLFLFMSKCLWARHWTQSCICWRGQRLCEWEANSKVFCPSR